MTVTSPAGQLALLVFQLVLIITAAQLFGMLAERFGQSKVIGEIIAGIALGPSIFGTVSPEAYHFVFKSTPGQSMSLLGEIGLVLLMFQIGLEFDLSHLKVRKNQMLSVSVALCGLVLPFGLGVGLGWWSKPYLAPSSPALGYILFMGIALSVTAVPVLARILLDLNIAHLHSSRVAMLAAAMTDVLAWIILAVVAAVAASKSYISGFLLQLVYLVIYIVACWYLVRPALVWLLAVVAAKKGSGMPVLAVMVVAALLSSLVTAALGFHSAFGGLMIGLLLNQQRHLLRQWQREASVFLSVTLMPVFFMLAGSRADLGSISSWTSAGWFAMFFLAAVAGKFGGCYAAARMGGMGHQDARIVGILMNTRGLMELIVLTIGVDLGLIPLETYSALVFMAIVTTLMTVPLVRRWMRHQPDVALHDAGVAGQGAPSHDAALESSAT